MIYIISHVIDSIITYIHIAMIKYSTIRKKYDGMSVKTT